MLPCNVCSKYADGYVNYTCFPAESSPLERNSYENFFFVTYLPYTHAHLHHQTDLLHASAYTSENLIFFHERSQSIFFFFFHSLSLMTLSHIRERKIRGERCSQYLVFCQTWSTHNRDISWNIIKSYRRRSFSLLHPSFEVYAGTVHVYKCANIDSVTTEKKEAMCNWSRMVLRFFFSWMSLEETSDANKLLNFPRIPVHRSRVFSFSLYMEKSDKNLMLVGTKKI